jgi:hypothetical protein
MIVVDERVRLPSQEQLNYLTDLLRRDSADSANSDSSSS